MSFIDFVIDLMWGASEAYLAKRKSRKAALRGHAADPEIPNKSGALDRAQADRERIERLMGNKTV